MKKQSSGSANSSKPAKPHPDFPLFPHATKRWAKIGPDDFAEYRAELPKTRRAVALGNEIQAVRSILKFAYEEGIIPTPVRFGTAFKKPSAKVLRVEQARHGSRDLPAGSIRPLIDAADVHLKAMILLGVNAGYGNNDCATLTIAAIDLWRRKVGCVALMMACVVMGAWMRSQFTSDVFCWSIGHESEVVISSNAVLSWWRLAMQRPVPRLWNPGFVSQGSDGTTYYFTIRDWGVELGPADSLSIPHLAFRDPTDVLLRLLDPLEWQATVGNITTTGG